MGEKESAWDRDQPQARIQWEPMTLFFLGEATRLIQGGGGKLSRSGADPGDARKPAGSG